MRDKKWVDCPSCGAKGTMVYKTDQEQTWTPKDYPTLTVSGLSGYICSECDDGFWTIASKNKLKAESGEHRARYDATRVPASDLVSVIKAAEILGVSRNSVMNKMREGSIDYVITLLGKLPIRSRLQRKVNVTERPKEDSSRMAGSL